MILTINNYLFGALHETRTLDGVATVLAAQPVVVVAAVGVVVFVLFPHHSCEGERGGQKKKKIILKINNRT